MNRFKVGDEAYLVNGHGDISVIRIQHVFDTGERIAYRSQDFWLYSPKEVFTHKEALLESKKILMKKLAVIDSELIKIPGALEETLHKHRHQI